MNNQDNNSRQKSPKKHRDSSRKDTLGLLSMIVGILGLIFSFFCTFISLVPGIIAIVCGFISKNQGQKFAISGIILGILAIITGIALTYVTMR